MGVSEAGENVLHLQARVIIEGFLHRCPLRQQPQDQLDRDPHPP